MVTVGVFFLSQTLISVNGSCVFGLERIIIRNNFTSIIIYFYCTFRPT